MRLTLTVVDPLGGASADVVLDIDPESSVGDISRELAHHVGHGGGAQIIPLGGRGTRDGSPLVYVDGYAVDPTATIVTSPLREGAVVSLHDPAGCLPGEPTGLVELRVAGGPAAGAVHRLGVGRYEIGNGPASYIRIDDPELPRAPSPCRLQPMAPAKSRSIPKRTVYASTVRNWRATTGRSAVSWPSGIRCWRSGVTLPRRRAQVVR